METFSASNGIKLMTDDGHITVKCVGGGAQTHQLSGSEGDALREFFRAEEDARLGVWRSKESPDWTAVRRNSTVYFQCEDHERSFHIRVKSPATLTGWTLELQKIAREYLDAHPEQKPEWHEAADGEVWVLTTRNGESAWLRNGNYFQNTRTFTNVLAVSDVFTAGRRIFPEVTA